MSETFENDRKWFGGNSGGNVAVMKNSYSEPFILFYKLRNNNLSLYYRKWFWPGMTLTKWPESWELTFNVVKIIRENDVVSKIKTA